MSQAMSFPVTDPFLLKYGTFLPQNREITVDPKWMTCDIVTAPGRFTYLNITEPRTPVINGQPGKPVFGGSIMLNPEGCSHVLQAIYAIAEKNWDPEQRIDPATGQPTKLTPSQLLTMGLPHGIGMPLVDGTTYWRNNRNPQKYELWRGLYVIGTNTPAETKGKPNAIICKDVRGERISPAAIKSGDYGRYMIRLYPTPRRGAQGYGTNRVCALLQGVQLMAPGEAPVEFRCGCGGRRCFRQCRRHQYRSDVPGIAEPDPAAWIRPTGRAGARLRDASAAAGPAAGSTAVSAASHAASGGDAGSSEWSTAGLCSVSRSGSATRFRAGRPSGCSGTRTGERTAGAADGLWRHRSTAPASVTYQDTDDFQPRSFTASGFFLSCTGCVVPI